MIRGVTRSGLLYECERIIKYCKPKYLLLENVKNLVGKKNKPQFDEWLKFLEDLGYTNYWKVLNAKDYGVPQNRERVFVVSISGEHEPYNFPPPIKLDKSIKDILEDEVEEKYYFKTDRAEKLILKVKDSISNKKECCDSTLLKPKILQVGNCITARYDAGIQNKQSIGVAVVEKVSTNKEYKLRKLTPLECWRLMAFTVEDFYKAKNVGISNSQLYKQAGNSIVVKVLEGIFKELFLSEKENNERDFEIVKLGNAEVEQFKWVI